MLSGSNMCELVTTKDGTVEDAKANRSVVGNLRAVCHYQIVQSVSLSYSFGAPYADAMSCSRAW